MRYLHVPNIKLCYLFMYEATELTEKYTHNYVLLFSFAAR